MSPRINLDDKIVREFCQKWKINELSLFGSVLRDDFGPDSDVDILVAFEPDARYSLFQFSRMQRELTAIIGYDVDLVEKSEVEGSDNPIRRKSVLETAQRVYAA